MYSIKQILTMDWYIVTTTTIFEELDCDGAICFQEEVEYNAICEDPTDYLANIAGEICAGDMRYVGTRPATFSEILDLYDRSNSVGVLYWDYHLDDPYCPEWYTELPF